MTLLVNFVLDFYNLNPIVAAGLCGLFPLVVADIVVVVVSVIILVVAALCWCYHCCC